MNVLENRVSKTEINELGKKLALLTAVIILILLIGEASMRAYGSYHNINFDLYSQELTSSDRMPEKLITQDPLLNWTLRPNTEALATTSDFSVLYNINDQRLRDRNYTYQKPDGETRVLAFGDSYTFGEGIKYGDRFSDIPENRIENLQIVNFGVPGYSIGQQLLRYYRDGKKYSADYVVIFVDNSQVRRENIDSSTLNHSLENINVTPTDKGNTIYQEGKKLENNTSFLTKHSNLFNYLSYRWKRFQIRDRLRRQDNKTWNRIFRTEDENLTPGVDVKNIRQLLKKFNSLVEKRDQKLVVVNIGITEPSTRIVPDNITYHDLSDELRERKKHKDLRFRIDPHYNPETHKFLGKELIPMFRNLKSEKKTH